MYDSSSSSCLQRFRRLICDQMGGSQGFVSFAIAEQFPHLNFIVQDTAGMRTPETIGTVPEALRDRVQLTTHDFFTEQTVVADVYFFRWIFHGFSEKYCVDILRKLTPALKKGARVVINDGVLPEPGIVGGVEEKSMRYVFAKDGRGRER
jgi:hypothetical protein